MPRKRSKRHNKIIEIARVLDESLFDYVNYNKLSKKIKLNYRTTKSYVKLITKTIKTLKIQHFPEGWEDIDELKGDLG